MISGPQSFSPHIIHWPRFLCFRFLLLDRYFHSKYSVHIVPKFLTFTPRTCHATDTRSTHHYFLVFLLLRKKYHSDCLFLTTVSLPFWLSPGRRTYSREDPSSMITIFSRCDYMTPRCDFSARPSPPSPMVSSSAPTTQEHQAVALVRSCVQGGAQPVNRPAEHLPQYLINAVFWVTSCVDLMTTLPALSNSLTHDLQNRDDLAGDLTTASCTISRILNNTQCFSFLKNCISYSLLIIHINRKYCLNLE